MTEEHESVRRVAVSYRRTVRCSSAGRAEGHPMRKGEHTKAYRVANNRGWVACKSLLGYAEVNDANVEPAWVLVMSPEVGSQLVLHPSECSSRSGLSGDKAIGDCGRPVSVSAGERCAVFDVCAPGGRGSLIAYMRSFSNSLESKRQRIYTKMKGIRTLSVWRHGL